MNSSTTVHCSLSSTGTRPQPTSSPFVSYLIHPVGVAEHTTKRVVYNGSSLLEQRRYAENLESIESKLRKKTIFVPTMDEEVKLQVPFAGSLFIPF